jgi:hypothetical protein
MEPPLKSWSLPKDCPDCKSDGGQPVRASTVADLPEVIRLRMRCPNCRREWDADVQNDVATKPLA